ncbi:MAG: hypothetical protein JSS99_10870 [Actinobacteria bacterium]|nr:hypothetical protein [Actinomycetota bacterium]
MTRALTQRLALLLTTGLAALTLALTLASPASATGFCGGQVISQASACWGAARIFTIVQGHGNETSVCVGYNEHRGPCSGGPNQNVEWNLGSAANRAPMIIGNAIRTTIGWGETF